MFKFFNKIVSEFMPGMAQNISGWWQGAAQNLTDYWTMDGGKENWQERNGNFLANTIKNNAKFVENQARLVQNTVQHCQEECCPKPGSKGEK